MGRKLRNGLVKPPGVSIHCINRMTARYKVRHATELEAWEHAQSLKEKRGVRYEPYFCKDCKNYHVGRPSSNLRLSMDATISKRAMREELGARAFAELMRGDTVRTIEHRYKVVRKRFGIYV